jgi:hypothetical protein
VDVDDKIYRRKYREECRRKFLPCRDLKIGDIIEVGY